MINKDFEEILLQNILQYADLGIHVINKERITIVYNEEMAQLEGLNRKNVLNKDLLKISPSLNKNSSILMKVLETGKPISNNTQTYLNYKGKSITTINTTIPLKNENQIIGALEIAKNITHVKKLSDQLMELQSELNDSYSNKNKGL